MRRLFLLGATTLTLALPLCAPAQWDDPWNLDGPRKPSGWTFVLGAGYAFPTGDVGEGLPLTDMIRGAVPLHTEVAYRFTPAWALGGYFSYAFGLLAEDVKDSCEASGLDCKERPIHAGLLLSYALNPASRSTVPWVALGVGYEWLRVSGNGDATLSGPEFQANLGLDFPSGSGRYGPFMGAALAKFNKASGDAGSADIPSDEQRTHGYLTVGLRMLFEL